MKRRLLLGALALLACDEGSGPEGPASAVGWLEDVEADVPVWLSDTGLYRDLTTLTPATGVLPYEPPHLLWSSGTDKHRLLYLPPGTTVDTRDGDAWDFPVGTVLVKTFSYPDIEGRTGDVPVETRLVFRREDGWHYAEYHWNAEGTEARAFQGSWPETLVELLGSDGVVFDYALPGRVDCQACHETNAGSPVIGISARNLPESLRGAGVFEPEPEPVALPGRTPEESAAMGYLLGNCVHCHHGQGGGDNAAFSLRPEDLVANTVNRPTESSASGDGVRVVPGDPEGSAIFEAVVLAPQPDYDGEFKPMPPLGVLRVDPDAARILRAWIEGL